MRNRWRAVALVIAATLLVSACGGSVPTDEFKGVAFEIPAEKPSFVLTDTEGRPYDFRSATYGRLTLLYFGYLSCPDICPVHLAQIAETFDQLPAIGREAEVVFVSVDPERDSPAEIREFLDKFDTRFIGLTGTVKELETAQLAAGVPLASKVGDGSDYTMNHAGQVFAFAPDGLGYTMYPFGTRQTEWANDLEILAGLKGEA